MNYIATFYTHYGAMCFHSHCAANYISAKLAPVPRELSSSCGVAVRFESERDVEAVRQNLELAKHEDLESCYIIENGTYTPVYP